MAGWYSRSVFFVTEMGKARRFYLDQLEFTEAWSYEEDGEIIVTQLNRADCEIILATDVGRAGKSRLFISLEQDEMSALQTLIETKQLHVKLGHWGYPVIEICDPDGNELLFPLDEEPTRAHNT